MSRIGRLLGLVYGVVVYLLFLAVFLYAIGFVTGIAVPRTVDAGGPSAPLAAALVVDLLLLGLFAVQHSVMARQWFKERWTKLVPWPVERSTFVLAATAILALLMWQWRPIPEVVWQVENATLASLLTGLSLVGWGIVLVATFLIDHFELFGLKQVWRELRGEEHRPPRFQTPFLYRFVRHPIYFGFLIAFWATPRMTVGHLLFAVATTGYMLVAIRFEERDLVRFHGEAYEDYREKVAMIVPRPGRTLSSDEGEGSGSGQRARGPGRD